MSSIIKTQDMRIKQASGFQDVTRNAPLFNDPRYTSSTLAIPTDERTLHGLFRFFAETDPIVGQALRTHAELPLADLRLGTCEDTGVQQHFEEMWERINGHKLLGDITSEYYEIGNVYPLGAFNTVDYMWDQFAILNPDYVKVESTWVNQKPLIKLVPDEALKRIVQTQKPRFIYEQLPPEIVRYVLFNQEIPLEANNVFSIAHAKRPYEVKGKSLIKRILKTLMLEDRFNQANFALATRHAVPLTVVKVGDPNTGWIPDQVEVDNLRDMFSAYELDPNFTIFYHYGINVEFYGSNGKMLPVGPELDRLYKLKYIGMGIHEQLMTGSGGTYAQAYVNLEVQRQRYLNLQLKLEFFMHTGVFRPVADLCGFYKVKQAVAGYGGVKSTKWGSVQAYQQHFASQFKDLRDYQDNTEFREFVRRKTAEYAQQSQRQVREYVYPKLDWGSMSASTDENLKNYVKWLAEKRPWLVDDATLARLARLDRDTQEKAYIEDLRRDQKRVVAIAKEGLTPFTQMKGRGGTGAGAGAGGGGGPIDFGGLPSDIDVGAPDTGLPALPAGGGGTPPPNAGGNIPPPAPGGPVGASQRPFLRLVTAEQGNIENEVAQDDVSIARENEAMLRQRSREDYALLKAVEG